MWFLAQCIVQEADSIATDAIHTNAVSIKIYIDRHIITLYIHLHQGVTISCVMQYDFVLDIKITVFAYSYI